MTTTLQQDANRKFGFSADRTMRIAQGLYEGIDLGGEQVGLITYMRTDSLVLSTEALGRIRSFIEHEYKDCLPDKAQHYTNKVRNAQEAHEAIRPTDVQHKPDQVRRFLNEDQFKLYQLIWQRTVASQMKPASVLRTEADVSVTADGKELTFLATGKQITFEGFLRVYLEGRDDDADSTERRLPKLTKGLEVNLVNLEPLGHQTKPPARYTDATLIKRLEEQGIGRPSTYASIISVIVDRGYVRKLGKQLIPTFKAFLTMEVLENNFQELMDLGFTAKMDEALDDISEGKEDSKTYLRGFFLGDEGRPGLKKMVDDRKREIPYPAFIVGAMPGTEEMIVVRNGKDGNAFLQVGEGDNKRYANVPEDLAPSDLTVEKAVEILDQKRPEAESAGLDPSTGRRLLIRNRQGFYLEVERTPEEIEGKVKPTWISVPPGVNPAQLAQEDLDLLCSLPKEIGTHPETSKPILFKIGKFGPYIESGEDRRTIENWRAVTTMQVGEAVEILNQPRFGGKRSASSAIKEFGALDGAAGPVRVLAGRYGPYITDGVTNATLPKGVVPEDLTEEQATTILTAKREAGPSARPAFKKKGRAPAKAAAAKPKAKAKKA
jgi:DNA topoisomerase-1